MLICWKRFAYSIQMNVRWIENTVLTSLVCCIQIICLGTATQNWVDYLPQSMCVSEDD